jgi:ribokinase
VSAANLNIDAAQVQVGAGVTVVLLQNEIPNAVNLAIAQKARAAGAQVWLNAAPARDCPAALLELVDLLIVNRVEAAFYEGAAVQTLATLGAEGVIFRGQAFPAFPVTVVSTHGAGDMFVGALAAGVDRGASIEDAIPLAAGAAALHVASDLEARAQLDITRVRSFLADQESR